MPLGNSGFGGVHNAELQSAWMIGLGWSDGTQMMCDGLQTGIFVKGWACHVLKTQGANEQALLEIAMMCIEDELSEALRDHVEAAGDFEVEHGDDGIGTYEYWGSVGNDSRPYTRVSCKGDVTLTVTVEEAPSDLVGQVVSCAVSGDCSSSLDVSGKIASAEVVDNEDGTFSVSVTLSYEGEGDGEPSEDDRDCDDRDDDRERDYDDRDCEYNPYD